MKHVTVLILRALVVLVVLAGCGALGLYFGGFFDPEPGVGFIRPAAGSPYVDEAALRAAAQAQQTPFAVGDAEDGIAQAALQLVQSGARVLVLSPKGTLPQEDQVALQQLAQSGVTLLFAGHDPGEAFLAGCGDLAWYVGSDPALAGELLGGQAAMLYRAGTAPDLNEDHLLQYAWLADRSAPEQTALLHYTLEECEHYGVYTAQTDSRQGTAEDLAQTALEGWSAADPRPEILLCSSAAAARAALEARSQLGWGEGPAIPVASFAADLQEAGALYQEGVAALCYYDLENVTAALAQLAANALAQQAITQGTSLVPGGHTFLLPYRVYEP